MRRRILGAILASTAIALAGFGVPLGLSVQQRYRDEALVRLSAAAAAGAVAVPGSFDREDDLPELPTSPADIDVALYDATGTRRTGVGPERGDATVEETLASGRLTQTPDDLVVAFPVSDEETVVGAIRASTPASTVRARTQRTWAAMAALATGVFALTTALAVRRSRTLARPLVELERQAAAVGDGGEVPPRTEAGIEEIDAVHDALVDAAHRLNDVLARERAFSADAAHQLRTPIASLRLRLENEQSDADHDQELVAGALGDLDRLEATIDDLVALARDVAPVGTARPLATVLKEVVAPWEEVAAAKDRALEVGLEPELPYVTARPQAVRQILDVLLANAFEHGAGTVRLEATRVGAGAVVSVADEGDARLDPEAVFVRRNAGATGTGIGLGLARRLADAEDLRLVLAHPGPGPRFHLAFSAARRDDP
ncbi:MAG: HAMP domain-containing histidine kinase [Acidimicrobiales bacterium]|nr:HAMP domain-containing histidine kinase [Acidimicrobiales bacterium]